MAATALDPNSALVIIDLQKGLANFPTVTPIADVVSNAARLAKAFRSHNLPVVLVNVTEGPSGRTQQPRRTGDRPSNFAEIMEELEPSDEDVRVTKRSWGAFMDTNLGQRLRSADVSQIVLAGVATSIGVESTAREAYSLGFNVTLASDAMTDLDQGAHDNSIAKIFPRLGEIGTTTEILSLLEDR